MSYKNYVTLNSDYPSPLKALREADVNVEELLLEVAQFVQNELRSANIESNRITYYYRSIESAVRQEFEGKYPVMNKRLCRQLLHNLDFFNGASEANLLKMPIEHVRVEDKLIVFEGNALPEDSEW